MINKAKTINNHNEGKCECSEDDQCACPHYDNGKKDSKKNCGTKEETTKKK